MVNLYQLLGISMQANAVQIQAALRAARIDGKINPQVLEKAEAWLLNAETKARYDTQLLQLEQTQAPLHVHQNRMPDMGEHHASEATSSPQKCSKESVFASDALPQEVLLQALWGEKKADYYQTCFDVVEQGGKAPWHWAAFFGGGYWLCARGMWLRGLVALILPLVLFFIGLSVLTAIAPKSWLLPAYLFTLAVAWVLGRFLYIPSNANAWYHAFAKQRIAQMRFKYPNKPQRMLKMLAATNNMLAAWVLFAVFGFFTMIAAMGLLTAILLPLYAKSL